MMEKPFTSSSENREDPRPYNIIIIKGYIDYMRKFYPQVDIDDLLRHVDISRNQLDDSRFWFSQDQADRFYARAMELTGNQNLARESGRYCARASSSPIYQYIAGFLGLSSVYNTIHLVSTKFSRGAEMTSRRIGSNQVEITSIPAPGISEKPYQCENRIGVLEGFGSIFSDTYSRIEHPECLHRGDSRCRYLISWEESKAFTWRRVRNYFVTLEVLLLVCLPFCISMALFVPAALGLVTLFLGINWWIEHLENIENRKNIENTGRTAELLLEEISSRSNDASLMQEIGLASSSTLDIDQLHAVITPLLQKRLDFERGSVLLIDSQGTYMNYRAGFGYSRHQERLFRKTRLKLDDPAWEIPFARAIRTRSPYLVNDMEGIMPRLPGHFNRGVERPWTRACLAVPIIFEGRTMGLVVMERSGSARPVSQNEISLLVGIAQQIGISINNARSFQQLRQSEERYRELVENANSIILRVNTRGQITFLNEFAQKFFGYPESGTVTQDLGHVAPVQDNPLREEILGWLRDIPQDPEGYMNTQTGVTLKDGRQAWIAWTVKPVRDEDNRMVGVLCIGNDITELRRIAQEKIRLEADLQRAQKMEALGTLAGGVAHDLNNILSGVVSLPDLLLTKIAPGDPMAKSLTSIRTAGEKAAAIVQDLLTMARRGVSIARVVNLNDIIEGYLNSTEFRGLAAHHPGVGIRTDLETPILNIMGSDIHLSKSIMNLVTNAAEAMPDGGTITITTQSVYVDRCIAGYDRITEGEYILLRVMDTGIGIDPADLPHVFEPFFTKKVMGRSGTGLGMAVIWGTVKDHNGYIDINSRVGEGTTIDIYLPATRRSLPREKAGPDLASMRGSENILVVDDIPEQREIASELLGELGYHVDTAASGEQALEYLRDHDPGIILLDMIMEPGMDGLETYRRILEIRPGQKAVIVSGFSETEQVKQALRMGAGAYVKKPYMLGRIGRVVRDELDRPAGPR